MSASCPGDRDTDVEGLSRSQLSQLYTIRFGRGVSLEQVSARDRQQIIEILQSDIRVTRTYLSDRRMTRSIAEAVQADGQVITEETIRENIARQDHALAQQLQGQRVTRAIQPRPAEIDNENLSKLAGRYVSYRAGEALLSTTQLGSRSSLMRHNPGEISKIQCTACNDLLPHFDVINVPCGHPYCQNCLQHLFCTSYVDESLFPPRCCRQEIPPASISIFLTRQVITDYHEKRIEFSTLNRTYCSDPSCAKFIPPGHISHNVGVCRACSKETCTLCKAAKHLNQECPADPAFQQLLAAAEENGWEQCYSCKRMVELAQGCYHITCPCGAEFCYLCCAPWKLCDCEQWDEEHLLERADEIVDRDNIARDDPGRAPQVQQMAEYLREQHNCDHHRWRSRGGSWRCEFCSDKMFRFIYECRQCRRLACRSCRYHRL